MKSSRKFLALLMVVFAGLTTGKGFAQCNPAFNQGASVNVAYCASGTCGSSVTVSISWSISTCSGLPDPSWEVVCDGLGTPASNTANGMEFVGTPTCTTVSGIRTCTAVVRGKAGNFMKGRVRARFSGICAVNAEIVRSIEVYKTFSKTDLDNRTSVLEPGNSLFYISGPRCVAAGDRVAFAVRPFVTNPPSDQIGQDSYNWSIPPGLVDPQTDGGGNPIFPIFAGDKSAFTIKIKDPIDFSNPNITIKLGDANPSQTVTSLPISQAARQPHIKPTNYGYGCYSSYNFPSTGTNPIAVVCMPANCTTSPFGLTLFAPETGVTYDWNIPGGFSLASGGLLNTSTINLKPYDEVNGTNVPGAGTIIVTAKTGCGNRTASLVINRTLVSGYNTIGISPAAGTGNCLEVNPTEYTFSLANAPVGQYYTWNFPDAGWVVQGANNGPSVKVKINPGSTGGTVSVSPILNNNSAGGNCPSTITSAVSYTVKGTQGANFAVTPPLTTGSAGNRFAEATLTNSTSFSGCNKANIQFQLGFNGTVSPGTGNYTASGQWFANNTEIFESAFTGFTPGNVPAWGFQTGAFPFSIGFRPGSTYNGKFAYRFRTNPGNNCTALGCLETDWYVYPASGTNSWSRSATEATWTGGVAGGSLAVVPNPIEKGVIQVFYPEGATQNISILSLEGKVLYSKPVSADYNFLAISDLKLAKGIYLIRSQGSTTKTTKFIVE